jgi:hypothetical protein
MKLNVNPEEWRGKHHPFMRNDEFATIFGSEVVRDVNFLEQRASSACPSCRGKCCQMIGCELYSPHLDFCPIYEYRPLKCRLFFCPKVTADEESLGIAEHMSNIILNRFGPGILCDKPFTILDERQIREGMGEKAKSIIQKLEREEIAPDRARGLLLNLILADMT